MKYNSPTLCLFFLNLVYASLIPLNPSLDLTGAAARDRRDLHLPTNDSSLTSGNSTVEQHPNANELETIPIGIEKLYEEYSDKYSDIELYKIILFNDFTSLLYSTSMNFKMIYKTDGSVLHIKWCYYHKHNLWAMYDHRNVWEEDDEFKGSTPINWSIGDPINLEQARTLLKQAPDGGIPDWQRNGPWQTISIVSYKRSQTTSFWDEKMFRFRANPKIKQRPFWPFCFDVLVGAFKKEVALIPPEYDFANPEPNIWGWGQDNRRSLEEIGPYTYLEYLKVGVKLVTETMGNGWYKDAQLVQVKIHNPQYHEYDPQSPKVVPQQYNNLTLYFKWQRGSNQKLLEYTAHFQRTQEDIKEGGNTWAGWDDKPTEYEWSDNKRYLEFLGADNPGEWLKAMDITDLSMSILSAFVRWRYYYSERQIKSWVIQDHLWLCKPNYDIHEAVNDQIVYYFPLHFFLGTQSGRYAEVEYSSIISNLTNLATSPGNVSIISS